MGLIDEFKQFAMRGNVVDMAVGVVIGVAFGAVVKTLVDRVIMPPLGLATGGIDFAEHKLVLREAAPEATDAAGAVVAAQPEVAIYWGEFVNTVIYFLLVAMALFVVIKLMNRATQLKKKAQDEQTPPPPEATPQEKLLEEIRDILRQRA